MSSKGLIRSRWAAIGAAVAVTLGGGGLIGVSAASGDASSLKTVTPTRIMDTRQGTDGKVSGKTVALQVTGEITTYTSSGPTAATVVPAGANAVSMNLTVTGGERNGDFGFVTAFPCTAATDTVPNASTLNFVEGVDVANSTVVPLGATGKICLNVYGSAHLIVDANGYYETASAGAVDAYTKAESDELLDGKLNSPECSESGLLIRTQSSWGCATLAYGPAKPDTIMASTQVTRDGQNPQHLISIAMPDDGRPFIAQRVSMTKITIDRCDDTRCSKYTELSSVSAPIDNLFSGPIIRLRDDGRPFIVIPMTLNNGLGPHRFSTISCDDIECSSYAQWYHPVGLKDGGAPIDIDFYSDDTPAILALKSAGPALFECLNISCLGAAEYTPGDFSTDLFTSDSSLNLVIHDDDTAMFSYLNWAPENQVLIGCKGAGARNCTSISDNHKTLFASQAGGGYYSDLALTSEGLPVFVYSADGHISVQFCETKTCEDKGDEVRGNGSSSIYYEQGEDFSDIQVRLTDHDLPIVTAIRDDANNTAVVLTCVDTSCTDAHLFDLGGGMEAHTAVGSDSFWTIGVTDLELASSPNGRFMAYGARTSDGNVHLRVGQIIAPAVTGIIQSS